MKLSRVALSALIGFGGLVVVSPVSAQESPPVDVTWQSAGDSYSSGEGVFGNVGDCAQSDQAYGPVAVRMLQKPPQNWKITNETFTACTGHLVEDFFHARGDSGNKKSLWDWGRQQGGPDPVDVITMSFGGNDVGFADVISECLVGIPDSWGEYALGGVASSFTGCDISEDELKRRADYLLDPVKRNCTTSRRSDKAYDCDIAIEGRRGSIVDFYYDVVTKHLTDRGRLYIVGYPRIFADTDQWPRWSAAACAGVKRGDTEKLGRSAEYLNNKLQEAVSRANQALGSDRVVFVDRFAYYRDGQHELCGRGDDWLNGIAVDRGEGLGVRKETSFHPNAAGHQGVATNLVKQVDSTFPRPTPTNPTQQSTGLTWSSSGLTELPWGTDRETVRAVLSEAWGRGPGDVFEDLGSECGPVTGSVLRWDNPFIIARFDLNGRLGSMSIDPGVVSHVSGIRPGDPFEQLLSAEPLAVWAGPMSGLEGESDYYEWTINDGDNHARGGLTAPPPDGRLEEFVHLSGRLDPGGCGE